MSSDFINYTFGKLIEDIRRVVYAGVSGMVNEIIEKKFAEIERIKERLEEIERILREQKGLVTTSEGMKEEGNIKVEEKTVDKGRCLVEGCDKPVLSRGYCKNHYYQMKRKGLLGNLDRKGAEKPCAFEGCNKPAISKGLCKNHYYQFKRGTIVYLDGKYIKKS